MRKTLEEVAELLGFEPVKVARLKVLRLEELQKQTRKRLLEVARVLDLGRVSKLVKTELAGRVHEALKALLHEPPPAESGAGAAAARAPEPARPQPSRPSGAPPDVRPVTGEAPAPDVPPAALPPPQAATAAPASETDPSLAAKLDLGPAGRAEEPAQHIPWSYGLDRITAAAVSPDRLYAYWEVTDPAIERARGALGAGGPGAWLNLRVYDTTSVIFDGTNAHSYFDHRLDRGDRQWFFDIGRPTSTVFVEIGLKSTEGFFAKIARSGRVDFPRKEPAPWSEPEWMTVVASPGGLERVGAAGQPTWAPPAAASGPGGGPPPPPFTPIPLWVLRETADGREVQVQVRDLESGGWERVEWHEVAGEGWFEIQGRVGWEGPRTLTSWKAGPFNYPVEIQPPLRQDWQGRSFAYRIGQVTHVVYGPWQVVIRNLGAHQEAAVLGRWEIYRSWVAQGGRDLRLAARPASPAGLAPGASEQLLGASERMWRGASELRLGGASEIWRLGASELRFGGASERLFIGASQWMLRGASERLFVGASQWMLRGASERSFLGASETLLRGASERVLGGASESLGGSESRLGASEQRLGGGATTPLPYPSTSNSPYPAE